MLPSDPLHCDIQATREHLHRHRRVLSHIRARQKMSVAPCIVAPVKCSRDNVKLSLSLLDSRNRCLRQLNFAWFTPSMQITNTSSRDVGTGPLALCSDFLLTSHDLQVGLQSCLLRLLGDGLSSARSIFHTNLALFGLPMRAQMDGATPLLPNTFHCSN